MSDATADGQEGETRRDFIYIATGAVAAIGAGAAVIPLVDQMNPAADTLAAGSIEVDLSPVQVGQQIKPFWRGKPVFVRRRTPEEIEAAEAVDVAKLPDPQPDDERVIAGPDGALQKEWLVMVGVCTHLGCIPLGERGDYDGWFCPCHGSHYDTAGRIRKGPAPRNMEIPPYEFLGPSRIKIG